MPFVEISEARSFSRASMAISAAALASYFDEMVTEQKGCECFELSQPSERGESCLDDLLVKRLGQISADHCLFDAFPPWMWRLVPFVEISEARSFSRASMAISAATLASYFDEMVTEQKP